MRKHEGLSRSQNVGLGNVFWFFFLGKGDITIHKYIMLLMPLELLRMIIMVIIMMIRIFTWMFSMSSELSHKIDDNLTLLISANWK